MKLNQNQLRLAVEIKKRQAENFSFCEFGKGLSLASRYVKGWSDLIANNTSCDYLKGIDIAEAIKQAEQTFTWCDGTQPDDVTEAGKDFFDGSASLKRFKLPNEVEVPKNALMVFRNVITTIDEDRDGDVLHTKGAKIDQPLPLLWQHLSALPIGKMLAVDKHDEKLLRVFSVLLDMNDLTEDTAKLIEAKVLRISHGFIPLKFNERDTDSKRVPWRGFDITEFEVMEESTVSVPSNRSAVIDMFSRDAFKSPIMQQIGKALFDNRLDKIYPGFSLLKYPEIDGKPNEDSHLESEEKETVDDVNNRTEDGDTDVNIDKSKSLATEITVEVTEKISGMAKSHAITGDLEKVKSFLAELNLIKVVKNNEVHDCTVLVETKGGRELSKANLQLLRDVVDDLVELKKAEGLSRAHVALINKNIDALNALIDKATPEDPIEGEDPLIPDGEQAPPKEAPCLEKAFIKFITFDADYDQLKRFDEILAARKAIDESIQVGNEFRSLNLV